MTALLDTFNNTDYYSGQYFGGQYGQVSKFQAAQAYTLANFGGNVDGQKTAADIYPNLFHTVEQITAGYVMNTIDFGRLHLQTGLRLENTNMMTFGYNLTFYGTYVPASQAYSGGSANVACKRQGAGTTRGWHCYVFTGVTTIRATWIFCPARRPVSHSHRTPLCARSSPAVLRDLIPTNWFRMSRLMIRPALSRPWPSAIPASARNMP